MVWVVLYFGKLAFKDFDYVLCETHSTNSIVKSYIDNKLIYNYDLIFVTDLCTRKEVIDLVSNDKLLSNKFFVFDHHKSEISKETLECPFITIKIDDEKGKCSGTSLFYEYLISNNYIKQNDNIDYLVELIRRYDTWEWKTIYNDENAFKLKVLFDILGKQQFISNMYDKLNSNKNVFTDEELNVIDEKINNTQIEVESIVSDVVIKNIEGINIAIVYNMKYEYRNEVAEYIREKGYDVSYVIMEIKEKNSASLRVIKDGFDVSLVAKKFGGKGHKEAASCPLSDKLYNYIN